MSQHRSRVSALDLVGMFALYLIAVALSTFFMPHLLNAPTWSDDPMWYVSSAVIGGLLGVTFLYLRGRNQKARHEQQFDGTDRQL